MSNPMVSFRLAPIDNAVLVKMLTRINRERRRGKQPRISKSAFIVEALRRYLDDKAERLTVLSTEKAGSVASPSRVVAGTRKRDRTSAK